MKVVGYVRVSTDMQVESGLGMEAQLRAIEGYADKMDYDIDVVFRDEGVSGSISMDKRPGILNAISCLQKHDVMVVSSRDRLGRDSVVIAMIESAVLRKGARIVSVAGEGTDNDDPSSVLMRRMVDAFAEYERLIIKSRIKAAMDSKRKRGERLGYIPFGFRLDEDKIHLIKDEHEQRILKIMIAQRDAGKSIREIALHLNTKALYNRTGSKWNHMSVYRVMKNK